MPSLRVEAPRGAVQTVSKCVTVMFTTGGIKLPCLVSKAHAHNDTYLRSLIDFMRNQLR